MSTEVAGPVGWRLGLVAQPGAAPLGAIFGAMGILGGAMVALLHLDRLPFTVCLFKALTGWPCMACGSTRAMGLLFRLDLPGALAMNPLATVGALGLFAWAVLDLVLWPRGRALTLSAGPRMAGMLRVMAVAAVLVNWAYLFAVGR